MARYAMSRRRRNFIIAVCVLILGVLFALDCTVVSPSRQTRPQTPQQQVTSDFDKYHGKTFTVVKVVDGDTIDIDIPDGNYPHTRIRLWGVDTPETKNPKTGVMFFGKEASEFTSKIAGEKEVTIYLDEGNRTRGKYGRLLAYVQLPDGTFLNERLLTGGYAYADVRFRHSLYNKYKQLESVARAERKGLWAGVQFEQLPEWLQRERPELQTKKIK